jgi:peptidoglycan/LPS O-acetylase OafA/YrhL
LFHAAEAVFPNGYLGVDAFFVISGFVVSPLLVAMLESFTSEGKRRQVGRFVDRRIRRLLPALGTLLLGTCLLLTFLVPVGGDQADPAKLGLTAVAITANFGAYAFAGDYFQHTPNPLIHMWSLSVEEQIYLLLPLLLVLAAGRTRLTARGLVIAVLLIVSTASLAMTLALSQNPAPLEAIGVARPHAGSFLFYATTSRVWEFGLGGLATLSPGVFTLRWGARHRIAAVVALILSAVLLYPVAFTLPFPSAEAGAAVLTALALGLSNGGAPRFSWLLQWLGDRSYSIYLWHLPLLIVAKHSPVISARQGGWLMASAAVIASVIVGALSFRWVEQAYRVRGDGASRRASLITIVLAFAVIPALALGALGLAARHHFWGLNGQQAPLPLGWNIDRTCARMDHASFQPCWYGPVDRPVALLVGDSHAAALSQSFVDAAQANGLRAAVQTHSFCPLVDEEVLTAEQRTRLSAIWNTNCWEHNKQIFQLLRQTQVEVLAVTSRSTAGYGYMLGAGGDAFFQSVSEVSLARARQLAGALVVIGPVAEFPGVNFGHGLFQPRRFTPWAAGELPQMPFIDDRRWKEFAARHDAGYVSAIDAACHAGTCSYDAYFDMTHLSVQGARLLQPALDSALEARERPRTAPNRSPRPPPSSTGPRRGAD